MQYMAGWDNATNVNICTVSVCTFCMFHYDYQNV
jgi:hypothetical protein